jgi:hypothetical protein
MAPYVPTPDVKITGRHTLQCASDSALDRLPSPFRLGPIDNLTLPFSLIGVNYIYKKQSSEPATGELIPVSRLRQALEHLLDYYPHLTGRLQLIQPDRSQFPTIGNLGKGAELVVAECSTTLDEVAARDGAQGRILAENLPDYGRALLTQPECTIEGIQRDPILMVQHTRFACGGVSLSITLHHMVCDGYGYFQFVRDLAQIYRVLRASPPHRQAYLPPQIHTKPPVIQPYLSQPDALTPKEQRSALAFHPDAVTLCPESSDPFPAVTTWNSRFPPGAPPVIGRLLRFSGAELTALKKHATNPNSSSNGGWVSTFEALTAHLCQRIYLARLTLLESQGVSRAAEEAEALLTRTFLASMNLRGTDRLGLGARYFGNGTYGPTANFPHALLREAPLWEVTAALHDVFRSVTPERMDRTVRWLAAQKDKTRARSGFDYGCGSFLVSQWSCFRMYDGIEFDVDCEGKGIAPVTVAAPFKPGTLLDGLALIFSTEEDLRPVEECGGVRALDVSLSISEPVWEILERDDEFRRFLT